MYVLSTSFCFCFPIAETVSFEYNFSDDIAKNCDPKNRRNHTMALTRKFLKAMGIEAEKIDEIIDAHSETIEALKKERDLYKEDAEKLTTVQKELDDIKAKGEEGYKAKYEKEHKDFEDYKNSQAKKEESAKKEKAYKALLKEAGISDKRIESIWKVTDASTIKLDKDGNIEDSANVKENAKKEWADFVVNEGKKGADTATPPEGGKGSDGKEVSRAAKVAQKYYSSIYGTKAEGDK